VETFFNLLWVAVTILLGAAWFANRRNSGAKSLLPAIGVQLVALAVLAAILLPVISLTDDLQANTNPAETERVTRRGDLQLSPDQPPASFACSSRSIGCGSHFFANASDGIFRCHGDGSTTAAWIFPRFQDAPPSPGLSYAARRSVVPLANADRS
jgi:hypothetical protein